MDRLLGAGTITALKGIRAAGQRSVGDLFTDTWALWKRQRPEGTWDDGSVGERWHTFIQSTGKLVTNGAGGPQIGEAGIYLESPYRLRTFAAPWLPFQAIGKSPQGMAPYSLVLNDSRLFRIDVVKLDDADDLLADVFLTELLDQLLPVEGMP